MKGSVASMISAFEKIIKLENRKYSPVLVLTSDEEAKGFAGIKKFLDIKNDLIAVLTFGYIGEKSTRSPRKPLMETVKYIT